MLFDMFDRTTSVLQQRFTRMYVAPVAFALGASLLSAWLATGHSVGSAIERWEELEGAIQVIVAICFVFTSISVGLLLAANATTIIRILEGYTGPSRLLALGCRYHEARRDRLPGVKRAYEYPPLPAPVMPTKLGNILRAAEDYPLFRYNIEAVIVWPRLYRVLSKEFTSELAAARENVDAALVISVVSGAVAVGGTVLLPLARATTVELFLAVVVPAVMIAALAYSSATSAAVVYAETIRVAFDLHRHALLEKLGFPIPRLDIEERELWVRLSASWFRGAPLPRPE